MIDRRRPNFFFRRRAWLGAIVLSVTTACFLVLLQSPGEFVLLAFLPIAGVAIGFAGVLFTLGLLGSSLRYPLRRVSECCPWCRLERPVRHRCPGCRTWHDDLRPSWYGVWTARCGVCDRTLATTDRGGRRLYDRSCGNPECGHALPPPLGDWPEYHLAVLGHETHQLGAMLRRFEADHAGPNRLRLQFLDPEEERRVRTGEEPARITLTLQMPNGEGSILFLSDLTTSGPTPRFLAVSRLDGLLFVIDPPLETASRSEVPGPAGRRFALRMAVVARSSDDALAPLVRDLAGLFVNTVAVRQEAERDLATVRQVLIERGLGPFVRGVESRFAPVGYFVVTPTDPPRGLATPLVWLLTTTGALTDASPARRRLAHLADYARRVWHGDEGELLAGCWLSVYGVLLLFVLFACVGSCLGKWAFFGVLVVGAAALWGSLYRRLMPRRG